LTPRPPAPPASTAAAAVAVSPPAETKGDPPPQTASEAVPPAAAPVSPPPSSEAKGGRPALGAYAGRSAPAAAPEKAAAVPEASDAGAARPEGSSAPTRDELVTAWGDHVLLGLRPKVKVIYMAGRFVGSEGNAAVFALPNAAHVSRAEPLQREVIDALSTHFGRPVGLTLTVDPGRESPAPAEAEVAVGAVKPGTARFAEPEEGEPFPEEEGLSDLGTQASEEDPNLGLTWAKDRLLQAFPGAEEVEEG
jgi:hypothetical protein